MAKYYGAIGFATSTEVTDGVWEESITELMYSGDVLQISRRMEKTDQLNENLVISNRISIVADAFLNDNFAKIRYVAWMGSRWSINSVKVERPRLELTLGGIYNG